jgi:hypothetical protein
MFQRQTKKLHKNQKLSLDQAIKDIASDPSIGQPKKGDLLGIQVHKFRMLDQVMLLAYELFADELKLVLLALGTHENFYRDIKR